jgi:hypothetical protein
MDRHFEKNTPTTQVKKEAAHILCGGSSIDAADLSYFKRNWPV